MKRPQKGSTVKQFAYATRKFGGQGSSKKEIALLSGFSPSVAANAKNKIEETEGYKNAVIVLATRSNNLLQAVMAEFEARGLKEFSNADLVKALNAISGAWAMIEKKRAPDHLKTPEGSPLRAMFIRRTESAVFETAPPAQHAPTPVPDSDVTVITTEEKLPREEDSLTPEDLDF